MPVLSNITNIAAWPYLNKFLLELCGCSLMYRGESDTYSVWLCITCRPFWGKFGSFIVHIIRRRDNCKQIRIHYPPDVIASAYHSGLAWHLFVVLVFMCCFTTELRHLSAGTCLTRTLPIKTPKFEVISARSSGWGSNDSNENDE